MTQVGLALSGGASHGDFEVGAVRYLYDIRKVKPQIISGTSVGSIAAVKLAEGEPNGTAKADASGHLQGLAGLEHIWSGLQGNSDMWKSAVNLDQLTKDAKALLGDVAATAVSGLLLGPIGLIAWLVSSGDSDLDKVKQDISKLMETRSLYNLDPIFSTMEKPSSVNLNQIKASGIKLRLAMVALEDGLLRYVTEAGAVIERDGKPTTITNYDPACAGPILQQIADLEAKIKDAQDSAFDKKDPVKGSLAGVAGMRNKQAQLRAKLAQCPKKQFPVTVDLLHGALASSSLPFVFPPVKIGPDWYIDGGVRMVTPIEGALQAGADFVYAVVASSKTMDPQHSILNHNVLTSYDPPANLLDIGARASEDIMPSEIGEDELSPPNGWGHPVVVIRPEYDLHDGMTIDPGYVQMRLAHGYMRADDVMQAYDKDPVNYRKIAGGYSSSRNTTAIVKLRKKIWYLEFAANGWKYKEDENGRPDKPAPGAEHSDQALEAVRHWKRELKEIVEQRIAAGGKCPPGHEKWWMEWEHHSWKPVQALWDAAHPFVPLKRMHVTVKPASLLVNKPVHFTVLADDGGKPINDAGVFCNGVKIGVTGTPITFTFKAKTQVVFDKETHHRSVELIPPSCSVSKAGYYTEDPFEFHGAGAAAGASQ